MGNSIISITPIQQISAVSAAINNGKLYTPFVVKRFIKKETGTTLKEITPNYKRKVISDETSSLVRYTLETVVAYGTGKNAYIENYRVGGKTGTAQKVIDGKYSSNSYILSFIGFMPADDPTLTIYVSIDGAKNVTQYGGTASAPVARNILKSAIEIMDIKESKDSLPKTYTWLDEKYVMMPDVTGLSLKDAKKLLNGFKINTTGTGEKVIYQSPKKNSYVKENGTIELLLG